MKFLQCWNNRKDHSEPQGPEDTQQYYFTSLAGAVCGTRRNRKSDWKLRHPQSHRLLQLLLWQVLTIPKSQIQPKPRIYSAPSIQLFKIKWVYWLSKPRCWGRMDRIPWIVFQFHPIPSTPETPTLGPKRDCQLSEMWRFAKMRLLGTFQGRK